MYQIDNKFKKMTEYVENISSLMHAYPVFAHIVLLCAWFSKHRIPGLCS